MLPYVETLYVSGTSPADQEKIMISSTTSSLVSPCHGHQPAAAFSSFPWFPLSPFAFDQGLQVFPIDEEVAHIVEEELNASTEMSPPSDPPAADHMTEVITVTVAPSVQTANAAAAALPEEKKNNARKRFRTDRHSKIHTSQGLRDRRMRLSLDVARQFFDLQDMLGFDKASHTISWLLTQSKEAIAQLTTRSSPGANRQAFNSPLSSFGSNDSSSEGEAISPNPKPPPGGFQPLGAVAPDAKSAKESRDKAKARARQRTREKNQKRLLPNACTLDYQLVAAHSKASILAASDSFEVPSNWNVMNDHNPVTRMPSWGFCNSHEEANLMDEQLKIVDPGNKHEDMVISWLM